MASAFQALPPPAPPPPSVVYPTTVTNQPSSHSNGSFEMVFLVLAIILVVSAAACALGRLCNKRSQRLSHQPRASNKYRGHGNDHYHDHDRGFSHGDGHRMPPNGRSNERDVEYGLGRIGGEPDLGFGSRGGESELGFGPKGGEPEFGFERKIPKVKIAPHGESRGQMMPPQNGQFGGPAIVHQMRMMESPRNFR